MSSLTDAWNAGYAAFVAKEGSYERLYARYMGVQQIPPDPDPGTATWPSPDGGLLASVLESGRIRIGTYLTKPFCYKDAETENDDGLTGFEYELAAAIFAEVAAHYDRAIAVKWAPQDIAIPGDGTDPFTIEKALREGLDRGDFDFVIAQTPVAMPVEHHGRPTAALYVAAMYTGASDWGEPDKGSNEEVAGWFARTAAAQDITGVGQGGVEQEGQERCVHVFTTFGSQQTADGRYFAALINRLAGADRRAVHTQLFIDEGKRSIELSLRHVYIGDSIQIQEMTQGEGAPYDLGLNFSRMPLGLRPFSLPDPTGG